MSLRTGDRARAHKIDRKRRVHRSQVRLLRRVSAPAQNERYEAAPTPLAIQGKDIVDFAPSILP